MHSLLGRRGAVSDLVVRGPKTPEPQPTPPQTSQHSGARASGQAHALGLLPQTHSPISPHGAGPGQVGAGGTALPGRGNERQGRKAPLGKYNPK